MIGVAQFAGWLGYSPWLSTGIQCTGGASILGALCGVAALLVGPSRRSAIVAASLGIAINGTLGSLCVYVLFF
jgi:VIT1/CCC1 family predicted Fe2+/Mn2+ transporter